MCTAALISCVDSLCYTGKEHKSISASFMDAVTKRNSLERFLPVAAHAAFLKMHLSRSPVAAAGLAVLSGSRADWGSASPSPHTSSSAPAPCDSPPPDAPAPAVTDTVRKKSEARGQAAS